MRPLLSLLSLLPFCAAQADPLLTPEEALKKFTAPEGFSVDLIAAEPDIVQPIAFCWDARGRIWVVEGRTYPSRKNNRPPGGDSAKPSPEQLSDIFGGDDRILIFADEDGDGRFETRRVFAEKLNLVSGIELGFGGVYVGAAPYLLHIPDKDKDDKPDGDPEILLDGWGWQDTHETLNSFIWGPDGWLYGCHGVFTHSYVGAPGTPKEKRVPINCHYWRFHPVRKTFEAYASGTSNSWGFDYNEYGDWFAEACVIPHFWHIIQGGYYLRQSNPLGHFNPYVYTNIETIADHLHYIGNTPHSGNNVSDAAGGGHAHCGLCIYNGDNFPPEYRGRAMMFNIHGQRINQEQLVQEGSGYVAKHLPDFVKANDKNFTGVALKVGPDGAIYFIDWYDKEKCHRPQPNVWDRSNGRIYRVKYDRTWKPWKGDMAKRTSVELLKDLGHSNGWAQRRSTLLLSERRDQEPGGIIATGPNAFVREMATEPGHALRAFWMHAQSPQNQKRGEWSLRYYAGQMSRFDKENDNRWRSAALCYALQMWTETGEIKVLPSLSPTKLTDELLEMAKGESAGIDNKPQPAPQSAKVRLAVASALQRLPLDDRWSIAEALIEHAEDAKDHNLPQMYWYAIEPLVPANPEKALELATKSKIPLISQHIARRLGEADGGVAHLVTALGKEKTADGTIHLLKAALQGLRGRTGEPAPRGWDGAWANIDDILARRPDAKPLAGEITGLREALAVAFGDKRAFPRLRAQVRDTNLPVERRQLALQTLLDGKDPEIPSIVMALLDDPAMRLSALNALPRATAK